ncbi:MAG TPA: DUF2520 domain-containing protein [Prolixibacteraceae bacterium]|nr:DUF2520 domain-containing protein [Prolixibacteraceae bacterium]
MQLKFVFIGAGNLATHFSTALKNAGYPILQVYSRTNLSAAKLAHKLNSDYTTSTDTISKEADVYVIAIKDSAFHEVLPAIEFSDKLLVHCSGSMPLNELEKYSKNTGVVYPLQTFSKKRKVNFLEIPVFVEANSKKYEKKLVEIAQQVSNTVSVLSSEKRIYLHIAAVFACNFVNHFYTIASTILSTQNIPFEVLKPLISETAAKVQLMQPEDAQTGPAIRFDENIIAKHLNELKGIKDYDELYNSVSKSIFEHHQKKI